MDFNKVLPSLAADKPDLFNAHQQTRGEKLEKAMTRASDVASFIRHDADKALFVGLYKIGRRGRSDVREECYASNLMAWIDH